MTEPKKKRGRPRKSTPAPRIWWKRFHCDHANPIAQTYACIDDFHANHQPSAHDHKDPTYHIVKGQFFVLFRSFDQYGVATAVWPGPRAEPLDRAKAEEIAKKLFREADPELQFGSLDGPRSHILYRNEVYEIWFSPAGTGTFDKPFVAVDHRFRKVLVDNRGVPRRFVTLHGAIDATNSLEQDVLKGRRG
ncbi:hypothetical protein vBCbaSRXM_35 [Citromicrobium phage vB_CbaS-RXM]|nr:hypothetical protein vBCbaSRXM_35 [Citromicrobium phage vB_CbaS-RXM]